MSSSKTKGIIMVLIAALLWSSNAPFVRWISLDAFSVAGVRGLVAGVVLLPFLRLKRISFNKYFVGFLVCFAALTFGIITALKTTSSAIALGMQYTSCLWLFLLAKPKKEDFNLKRLFPLILVLLGVIITMFSTAKGITLLGNIIAISTSFSFAGLTYFAKKLNTDNPIGLSSLSNLIVGVVAIFIAKPTLQIVSNVQFSEWAVLLYLGVFQIGASYALYYSGLKFISAGTASMIAPLEMILGPVWTLIFLGEMPDLIGAVGFIIVIAGVISEAIVSAKHDKYGKNTPLTNGKESNA